jgi:hypothetical protein
MRGARTPAPRRPFGDACPAPGAGRGADLLLEGAVEGGLGVVADRGGRLRDAHALHADGVGGELRPPGREILHRRGSDEAAKRSAKVERDRPTSCASASSDQRVAGRPCISGGGAPAVAEAFAQ